VSPRHLVVCSWEHDVARSAADGPEALSPDVRAHVEVCVTCRDVMAATSALRHADAAAGARRVPDAALVWHRAQMRARRDNAREAAGPIWAMQIAAGAMALLLCAIFAAELAAIVSSGTRTLWARVVAAAANLNDVAAELTISDGTLGRVADVFGGPVLTALVLGTLLVTAALALSRLADRPPRG
jgi:hypothetical protein